MYFGIVSFVDICDKKNLFLCRVDIILLTYTLVCRLGLYYTYTQNYEKILQENLTFRKIYKNYVIGDMGGHILLNYPPK